MTRNPDHKAIFYIGFERSNPTHKEDKNMVVKSKRDAWRIAELIFPGDFRLDTAASLRAGYSIYSPCDLEELPFENGDEKIQIFRAQNLRSWYPS